MKSFKTYFLVSLVSICIGYFANDAELTDALVQTYKTISTQNIPPTAKPNPVSTQQKAKINFNLQQQYQKILNQQGGQQESFNEDEKLELLNSALSQLEQAEDAYDRELAIMTLGELNGPEAKQGIITALNDESDLVVSQAIRQINKWQNPAGRTEMQLTALQNSNDDIIEQTLLSISVVEDKKLIARLKQLLKHANPDIREAAHLALNLAP